MDRLGSNEKFSMRSLCAKCLFKVSTSNYVQERNEIHTSIKHLK